MSGPIPEALLARARAYACEFRRDGLALDAAPGRAADLAQSPVARQVGFLGVARSWNPFPMETDDGSFFEIPLAWRCRIVEELAYGDAGVLLACPGPALTSAILDDLGTETQREWFYSRLGREVPSWAFFALTEPRVGTDAGRIQSCRAENGSLVVDKTLIGNAHRGSVGVLFARVAAGSGDLGELGIRAYLVERGPSWHSERLATLGLRGAEVARLRFEESIPAERVLGAGRSPLRQGLMGALRSFHRFRPSVAAMALGVGRAALDEVGHLSRSLPFQRRAHFDRLRDEALSLRRLVRRAAELVERDPDDGSLTAVAKFRATRFAEAATAFAVRAVSPVALLENPFLGKWYRDARAFEYMEGTTSVHLGTTARSYYGKRLGRMA